MKSWSNSLPKLTFAGDKAPGFKARETRDLSIRHHMFLIGVTEASWKIWRESVRVVREYVGGACDSALG